MRRTVLTASLAAMVGVSAIGCKSMPSLAWWKTAKKNDAGSTALAQSAPALPSDVALKTEGLAAAQTVPPAGGMAAPFAASAAPPASMTTSGVTPASYPNTGVPAGYPTTSAPSFAGNAPTSYPSTTPHQASIPADTNNANMGSIAMPYNPNAVPPAATTAATPAAAPSSADRYATASRPAMNTASAPSMGTTSTPSFSTSNNMAASSASPYGDAGSRYGVPAASAAAPAPSYAAEPIQSNTPPAGASSPALTGSVGDRYAQASTTPMSTAPASAAPAATTTAPAAQTTQQASSQTVTQTAASQPYRPGGTSTYPGAAEEEQNIEVASRPEATSTDSSSTVPNVATPGYTPAPTQTSPQVPRYW